MRDDIRRGCQLKLEAGCQISISSSAWLIWPKIMSRSFHKVRGSCAAHWLNRAFYLGRRANTTETSDANSAQLLSHYSHRDGNLDRMRWK